MILTQLATAVTFQTLLKGRRAESALSYDQLGARSCVDPAYLFGLESGRKNNASRDVVIRIGVGLGLDVQGIDELVVSVGHVALIHQRQSKSTASTP